MRRKKEWTGPLIVVGSTGQMTTVKSENVTQCATFNAFQTCCATEISLNLFGFKLNQHVRSPPVSDILPNDWSQRIPDYGNLRKREEGNPRSTSSKTLKVFPVGGSRRC